MLESLFRAREERQDGMPMETEFLLRDRVK